MKLTIATDGACLGNPGPGGWAFVVQDENGEVFFEDSDKSNISTTNNRMELIAVIQALEWIKDRGEDDTLTVQSDSQYVIKGITEWLTSWKKRGWRTSSKEPVKNKDLWRELDRLNDLVKPEWEWVRGHNGHALNERADKLANAQAGITS